MFEFRWLLLAALSLLLATSAHAANPYNGSWDLEFQGANVPMTGTVVINEGAGTWKVDVESKNSPCVGRESQIAVTKSTDTDLVFDVLRSKNQATCRDWSVKLKRVDEKTLKGEFADGRAITLQRSSEEEEDDDS